MASESVAVKAETCHNSSIVLRNLKVRGIEVDGPVSGSSFLFDDVECMTVTGDAQQPAKLSCIYFSGRLSDVGFLRMTSIRWRVERFHFANMYGFYLIRHADSVDGVREEYRLENSNLFVHWRPGVPPSDTRTLFYLLSAQNVTAAATTTSTTTTRNRQLVTANTFMHVDVNTPQQDAYIRHIRFRAIHGFDNVSMTQATTRTWVVTTATFQFANFLFINSLENIARFRFRDISIQLWAVANTTVATYKMFFDSYIMMTNIHNKIHNVGRLEWEDVDFQANISVVHNIRLIGVGFDSVGANVDDDKPTVFNSSLIALRNVTLRPWRVESVRGTARVSVWHIRPEMISDVETILFSEANVIADYDDASDRPIVLPPSSQGEEEPEVISTTGRVIDGVRAFGAACIEGARFVRILRVQHIIFDKCVIVCRRAGLVSEVRGARVQLLQAEPLDGSDYAALPRRQGNFTFRNGCTVDVTISALWDATALIAAFRLEINWFGTMLFSGTTVTGYLESRSQNWKTASGRNITITAAHVQFEKTVARFDSLILEKTTTTVGAIARGVSEAVVCAIRFGILKHSSHKAECEWRNFRKILMKDVLVSGGVYSEWSDAWLLGLHAFGAVKFANENVGDGIELDNVSIIAESMSSYGLMPTQIGCQVCRCNKEVEPPAGTDPKRKRYESCCRVSTECLAPYGPFLCDDEIMFQREGTVECSGTSSSTSSFNNRREGIQRNWNSAIHNAQSGGKYRSARISALYLHGGAIEVDTISVAGSTVRGVARPISDTLGPQTYASISLVTVQGDYHRGRNYSVVASSVLARHVAGNMDVPLLNDPDNALTATAFVSWFAGPVRNISYIQHKNCELDAMVRGTGASKNPVPFLAIAANQNKLAYAQLVSATKSMRGVGQIIMDGCHVGCDLVAAGPVMCYNFLAASGIALDEAQVFRSSSSNQINKPSWLPLGLEDSALLVARNSLAVVKQMTSSHGPALVSVLAFTSTVEDGALVGCSNCTIKFGEDNNKNNGAVISGAINVYVGIMTFNYQVQSTGRLECVTCSIFGARLAVQIGTTYSTLLTFATPAGQSIASLVAVLLCVDWAFLDIPGDAKYRAVPKLVNVGSVLVRDSSAELLRATSNAPLSAAILHLGDGAQNVATITVERSVVECVDMRVHDDDDASSSKNSGGGGGGGGGGNSSVGGIVFRSSAENVGSIVFKDSVVIAGSVVSASRCASVDGLWLDMLPWLAVQQKNHGAPGSSFISSSAGGVLLSNVTVTSGSKLLRGGQTSESSLFRATRGVEVLLAGGGGGGGVRLISCTLDDRQGRQCDTAAGARGGQTNDVRSCSFFHLAGLRGVSSSSTSSFDSISGHFAASGGTAFLSSPSSSSSFSSSSFSLVAGVPSVLSPRHVSFKFSSSRNKFMKTGTVYSNPHFSTYDVKQQHPSLWDLKESTWVFNCPADSSLLSSSAASSASWSPSLIRNFLFWGPRSHATVDFNCPISNTKSLAPTPSQSEQQTHTDSDTFLFVPPYRSVLRKAASAVMGTANIMSLVSSPADATAGMRSRHVFFTVAQIATGECGAASSRREPTEAPALTMSPFQIDVPNVAAGGGDAGNHNNKPSFYYDASTGEKKSVGAGGYLPGMVIGNILCVALVFLLGLLGFYVKWLIDFRKQERSYKLRSDEDRRRGLHPKPKRFKNFQQLVAHSSPMSMLPAVYATIFLLDPTIAAAVSLAFAEWASMGWRVFGPTVAILVLAGVGFVFWAFLVRRDPKIEIWKPLKMMAMSDSKHEKNHPHYRDYEQYLLDTKNDQHQSNILDDDDDVTVPCCPRCLVTVMKYLFFPEGEWIVPEPGSSRNNKKSCSSEAGTTRRSSSRATSNKRIVVTPQQYEQTLCAVQFVKKFVLRAPRFLVAEIGSLVALAFSTIVGGAVGGMPGCVAQVVITVVVLVAHLAASLVLQPNQKRMQRIAIPILTVISIVVVVCAIIGGVSEDVTGQMMMALSIIQLVVSVLLCCGFVFRQIFLRLKQHKKMKEQEAVERNGGVAFSMSMSSRRRRSSGGSGSGAEDNDNSKNNYFIELDLVPPAAPIVRSPLLSSSLPPSPTAHHHHHHHAQQQQQQHFHNHHMDELLIPAAAALPVASSRRGDKVNDNGRRSQQSRQHQQQRPMRERSANPTQQQQQQQHSNRRNSHRQRSPSPLRSQSSTSFSPPASPSASPSFRHLATRDDYFQRFRELQEQMGRSPKNQRT